MNVRRHIRRASSPRIRITPVQFFFLVLVLCYAAAFAAPHAGAALVALGSAARAAATLAVQAGVLGGLIWASLPAKSGKGK